MREEYGLKKDFFSNWTSRGVNSGITQFHTQFTHVSRKFWALSKKKTKNSLWKTVLKIWSQICGKMLVDKVALTKNAKKKKHIKLNNLKAHFFSRLLFWHIMPFFYKLETTFSNKFFLKYIFFCFYSKLNFV